MISKQLIVYFVMILWKIDMAKVALLNEIFLVFISKPKFNQKRESKTYLAFAKPVNIVCMYIMWNKEANYKSVHGYFQIVVQIGKAFQATNSAFVIISP